MNMTLEQSRYMYPLIPTTEDEEVGRLPKNFSIISCSGLYHKEHGISQAWTAGYSGKRINIGIIDAGFHGKHTDSLPINISFALDFKSKVGEIHQTNTEANNMNEASDKSCDLCDIGIAYDAHYVDIEIGSFIGITRAHATDADSFAKALVYKQFQVDIYACEWKFDFELRETDIAIQSSIQSGVKVGRGGLGSIYVLPAGYAGDGFVNDTFVISVGSVCCNQTHYGDLIINSATLVSAIYIENHKSRRRSNSCFGHYTAPGMVAGMIALTLEANRDLTIRDIKQILIKSSGHLGLDFSNEFSPNGAGHYFHPALGFGYPNVTQMIKYAKSWKRLPMQYTYRYKMDNKNETSVLSCTVSGEKYVHKIEEVVVQIKRITFRKRFILLLISPNGTLSILYESPEIPTDHWSSKPVNRWFMSTHFWGEDSSGIWKLHCLGCTFMSAVLVIQGLGQSEKDISTHKTSHPEYVSLNIVFTFIQSVIMIIMIIIILRRRIRACCYNLTKHYNSTTNIELRDAVLLEQK
ncbi:proprotein convertase subtilisin/kexin type 6-like isoform X2 [Mya arenaria]|nr:proprotein convertase subtilisin/kexin type 6-like isoform X2 [Mya arenaria]